MNQTFAFLLPRPLLLIGLLLLPFPSAAMHREDNSKYFLFIEPDSTKKAAQPVQDELTDSLAAAMAQSEKGTSDYSNLRCQGKFNKSGGGYRGFHFSEDGQVSDVVDYLLPNGLITNSLALHYVRFYRSELPQTEQRKLKDLHKFMQDHDKKTDKGKEEL